MRQDYEEKYRNCDLSYSIYGSNEEYSAKGYISIHTGNASTDYEVFPPETPWTDAETAKKEFLALMKKRTDELLKNYKPVKPSNHSKE